MELKSPTWHLFSISTCDFVPGLKTLLRLPLLVPLFHLRGALPRLPFLIPFFHLRGALPRSCIIGSLSTGVMWMILVSCLVSAPFQDYCIPLLRLGSTYGFVTLSGFFPLFSFFSLVPLVLHVNFGFGVPTWVTSSDFAFA